MLEIYNYVYKTTNTINNKIYIGVHRGPITDTTWYKGSGYQIRSAIKKYGILNFTTEIIKLFPNTDNGRILSYELEKELVTEEFISSDNNYNMSLGGNGSFHHVNKYKYDYFYHKDDINKTLLYMIDENIDDDYIRTDASTYYHKDDKEMVKVVLSTSDPRVLSNEYLSIMSNTSPYYHKDDKNKVLVRLNTNDPLVLDGTYIHRDSGTSIYLKSGDINSPGIVMRKDDPRVLSGEYISRSQGKVFINDGITNKFIFESETSEYLTNGWTLGRVFTNRTYKGRVSTEYNCPHCGKVGYGGNMKRYHFDNCKLLK